MPIYEYRCAACGHHLEALQKMTDAPLRKCPDCGKSQLKRLVSAPQFRLKGSGWYETDFKKDGDRKRNLSGEGGEGAKPAAEPAPAATKPAGSAASPAASTPAAPKPEPAKPATGP